MGIVGSITGKELVKAYRREFASVVSPLTDYQKAVFEWVLFGLHEIPSVSPEGQAELKVAMDGFKWQLVGLYPPANVQDFKAQRLLWLQSIRSKVASPDGAFVKTGARHQTPLDC